MEKISGYITTRNCVDLNYPFEASIRSLLAFCDEVVVGDSSDSNDGTKEILEALAREDSRVKVFHKDVDWSAPNYGVFDGQMKAFARSKCTGDILVQIDADEVFDDSTKEKFPKFLEKVNYLKDIPLAALPVIEYWGSKEKVRVDVNPWKWRVSRNNPDITHGIPAGLRWYKNGLLYCRPGSDGCVVPETKIMTIKGEVNIKDVKVGDLVYTHKGRFRKVTKVFVRPDKTWDLYSISCLEYINNTLKITGNHPLYIGNKTNPNNEPKWHSFDDGPLQKNDCFVFPKLKNEKEENIEYEFKDLKIKPSRDLGFLIGLYLGDGNVVMRTENKKKFKFTSFALSLYQDKTVERLEQILKNHFNFDKIYKDKNLKKNYWNIRIFDAKFAEFMFNLCNTGSRTKILDNSAFDWNTEAIEGLLEGLYESDGADCASGINITMVNGGLLSQIKTILTKINIYCSLKSYQKISGFSKHQIEMFQLRVTGKQTDKLSFIKKEDLKKKQRFTETDSYFLLNSLKKSNKIEKITYTGKLYNLEIEEDHSYVANGITVHNCDYISKLSGEITPCIHFVNKKINDARVAAITDENKVETYQKWFQHVVDVLPTVHHFSWWNIGVKIRKFRGFWNNSWLTLYGEKQDKPEGWNPFFSNKTLDEVTEKEIDDLGLELANKTGGHIFHSPWDGRKTNSVSLKVDLPQPIVLWAEANKAG
jgi:hypothetical protein